MGNSVLPNIIQRNSQLAKDFCVSASFVLTLCFFFEPRWETNDDVGMSMVAHGYGIAAIGSPNLIFSNVVWGYLVRLIPQIDGVLGYSVVTIGVLVIVGTVLLHALRKIIFRLAGFAICSDSLVGTTCSFSTIYNQRWVAYSWGSYLLAALWSEGKQASTRHRVSFSFLWVSRS